MRMFYDAPHKPDFINRAMALSERIEVHELNCGISFLRRPSLVTPDEAFKRLCRSDFVLYRFLESKEYDFQAFVRFHDPDRIGVDLFMFIDLDEGNGKKLISEFDLHKILF